MAAMARAEPTTVIPGLPDGHAPEVRAHTEHDEPVGLLHAVRVRLRVAQRLPLCGFGLVDLCARAVADEDGFAAPFDDYLERSVSCR